MSVETRRPRVRIRVEIQRELDVTDVLDGWTLDEVREFVEDQDEEGRAILVAEGKVETEDRYPEIRTEALARYLAAREPKP
jgi:hypothetical protein